MNTINLNGKEYIEKSYYEDNTLNILNPKESDSEKRIKKAVEGKNSFNCDECCRDFNYKFDTINGRGQYCKECIDRLIK